MTSTKQQVIMQALTKKVVEQERQLAVVKKRLAKEKALLNAVSTNNKKTVVFFVKSCRVVAGVLFTIGLPFSFAGSNLSTSIVVASAFTMITLQSVALRLEKNDIIKKRKHRTEILKLKKNEKTIKLCLMELNEQMEHNTVETKTKASEQLIKELGDCCKKGVFHSNQNNQIEPMIELNDAVCQIE